MIQKQPRLHEIWYNVLLLSDLSDPQKTIRRAIEHNYSLEVADVYRSNFPEIAYQLQSMGYSCRYVQYKDQYDGLEVHSLSALFEMPKDEQRLFSELVDFTMSYLREVKSQDAYDDHEYDIRYGKEAALEEVLEAAQKLQATPVETILDVAEAKLAELQAARSENIDELLSNATKQRIVKDLTKYALNIVAMHEDSTHKRVADMLKEDLQDG